MFADDQWSGCNFRGPYGIYIWTAGQWENPKTKSKFMWKWSNEKEELKLVEFKNQDVGYTNWHMHQPNNHGGHEACVNLLKEYDYMWNDEPCDREYCFLCENDSYSV